VKAAPLTLAAALLAASGLARAGLPCGGWVESGDTLELQGPRGHLVLRGSPETLAALRRTLLFRCDDQQAEGPRPPLDVGPVDIEAVLRPDPEMRGAVVEMRLRMHAERVQMETR
jgi:hypothetical protein